MSEKGTQNKEIKKTLQKYLKQPSEEVEADLLKLDYLPVLKSLLGKLSREKLDAAVKLLLKDLSEGSTEVLHAVSLDGSFPAYIRIVAIECIEARGEVVGKNIDRRLLEEMTRVADADDANVAGGLVQQVGENELEAWIALLVEKQAVNALAALGAVVKDKKSLKLLKRATYELRSKGIEVPDLEEKGESVLKPPEEIDPVALCTVADGEGLRVVFLQLPHEGYGVHVVVAVEDEINGIKDFQASDTTRGNARSFMKQLLSDSNVSFFDVSVAHASHVLDRAVAKMSEKGLGTPPGYVQTRGILKIFTTEYELPDPKTLITEEVSIGDIRDSVKLLELPALASWLPDYDSLNACKLKLDEAMSSTLAINEAQKLEQIAKAFEDSAKAYLTPENKSLLVERLKEAARLFAWNGEETQARWAVAAFEDIEKEESLPQLVVDMFKRAFPEAKNYNAAAASMDDKEPAPSGGGIIIP